jgi:4-diphosphocytidyl-2-C-methyl-D-erythritol kinase
MTTNILKAYAKINIGLHLIRKRLDGYHDIETIFHRIQLYDEISFEPASSITLTCPDPNIPSDERNLCVRAALLLKQQVGITTGVHINLRKQIPVGAGLGGGSSDAATTLLGLADFWNQQLSTVDLASIALQLGSDVPYFLNNGSAYAQGRGEQLEYFLIDVPYWIVLVYPDIHISTAWAYQNSVLQPNAAAGSLQNTVREHINDTKRFITLVRNDFESLVLRTHPEVAAVKQALYLHGAEFAQMSGSGSAVYGFFRNKADADKAALTFRHYPVSITPPHFQS